MAMLKLGVKEDGEDRNAIRVDQGAKHRGPSFRGLLT